jgi:hypothetical protein
MYYLFDTFLCFLQEYETYQINLVVFIDIIIVIATLKQICLMNYINYETKAIYYL